MTAHTSAGSSTDEPLDVKANCCAAYSSDAVALLLGDSYHPGGLALSRRLAAKLRLAAGQQVLDVASGPGATALLLASELGVEVQGVDLAPANVERAGRAAKEAGLAGRVRFTVGDAEKLPCPDAGFDAVVCECALCTFPDKPAAAAEFARVLRPGGRVGITDVTVDQARLPAELTGMMAWVACIADARPLEVYAEVLRAAGLRVLVSERQDEAVRRMVEQIEARLTVLRITARDRLVAAGIDLDRAGPMLAATRRAIEDGVLGYGLLVAEKPR